MASADGVVRLDVCSNCRKPATAACMGCLASPNHDFTSHITTTYYCSRACQTAAWPTHKATCKVLQLKRSLYRAAETIQKGFFIFREKTFDKLIIKVEEKNDMLLLTEGFYNKDEVFVPFPGELVKNEMDRQAVLTHLTCTDALGWMHDFTYLMFKGFNARFEEIAVKSKNFRRSTKIVCPLGSGTEIDSRGYTHAIVRVTIPDIGSYALDIASAQYGYHDPIKPWAEYMKQRVESVVAYLPFGTQKQSFERDLLESELCKPRTSEVKEVSLHTSLIMFSMEFMEGFNTAVQGWLEKEGWTDLGKMLRLAPKDFKEKQSGLLKGIDSYLQIFKDRQIDRGRLGQRFQGNSVPRSPKDKLMDVMVETVRKKMDETDLSTKAVLTDMLEKATGRKLTVEEERLLGTSSEYSSSY